MHLLLQATNEDAQKHKYPYRLFHITKTIKKIGSSLSPIKLAKNEPPYTACKMFINATADLKKKQFNYIKNTLISCLFTSQGTLNISKYPKSLAAKNYLWDLYKEFFNACEQDLGLVRDIYTRRINFGPSMQIYINTGSGPARSFPESFQENSLAFDIIGTDDIYTIDIALNEHGWIQDAVSGTFKKSFLTDKKGCYITFTDLR